MQTRSGGNFIQLGCFEVYFMGVSIFSKLQCNQFPDINFTAKICSRVYHDFIDGKDITKYNAAGNKLEH